MAHVVTMKMIAERAGCSISSVSRLLRGERADCYSADMKERIWRVAHELGWRPNLLVSGLRHKKTNTVGVLIPPYDPHWSQVMLAVHDTLITAGYVSMMIWPMRGGIRELQVPEKLKNTEIDLIRSAPRDEYELLCCFIDRRVDGLITAPLHEKKSREYLLSLTDKEWPVVVIEQEFPERTNPLSIVYDENQMMRLAIKHLIQQKHRQILYVGRREKLGWVLHREEAFRKNAVSLKCVPYEIQVDPWGDEIPQSIITALQKNPEITAVIAENDTFAVRAIRGAEAAGRIIPRDLNVIGFGNMSSRWAVHGLTSIDQQPLETGRIAAEHFLGMIEGKKYKSPVTVKGQLIIRGSTVAESPGNTHHFV